MSLSRLAPGRRHGGTVRRRSRSHNRGFTLTEVLVSMGIAAVFTLVMSSMLVTTFTTFYQQIKQGEMNGRARILMATFTMDASSAYQVAYSGAGPFTPPTLASPLSYNTTAADGASITQIPSGTKIVVFQLPARDANGFITNGWDYVGYSWTQPNTVAGTTGQIIRTVIPTQGSTRSPVSYVIPSGGDFDASLSIQFHVSNTFSGTYSDNSYSDDATDTSAGTGTTGTSLFQYIGSPAPTPLVGVGNVDQVTLTATIAGTGWGKNIQQSETCSATLREWGRTLGLTGISNQPPSAPSGLSAAGGNAQVVLTWNSVTNAASYKVYRATTSGGPYTLLGSVTSTTYTDTLVTNGTTYYYVVSALDSSSDEGPDSSQVMATPSSTGPRAPTGLLATAGSTSMSLSWTASTNAVSYRVKRSSVSGGPYTVMGSTTSTSYTDSSGINAFTTYYYVVCALNNGGVAGSDSTEVAVTTLPLPPSTPTLTGCSSSGGGNSWSIHLTWNQQSSGITSVSIYRSTTGSTGSYSLLTSVTSNFGSYTDPNLSRHTTYYYELTATGPGGTSSYSTALNATTGG